MTTDSTEPVVVETATAEPSRSEGSATEGVLVTCTVCGTASDAMPVTPGRELALCPRCRAAAVGVAKSGWELLRAVLRRTLLSPPAPPSAPTSVK
jgi:hypothetical protein